MTDSTESGRSRTGAEGSADTPVDGTQLVRRDSHGADRDVCPRCGAPRPTRSEFCEHCGESLGRASNASAAYRHHWVVEVVADRAHFDALAPEGFDFPAQRRASLVAFDGDAIVIGRRNESRGIHPDVDLSGDLADPGASQQHACIVRTPDGRHHLIDMGSTNGTTVNGGSEPIAAGTPVSIGDGDRVHIGLWTTVRLRLLADSLGHDRATG